MDRPGVARFEPRLFLVDGVDVTLGQELADPPHVTVQREELVADVVGDLPELRPGRQALCGRARCPTTRACGHAARSPSATRSPSRRAIATASVFNDSARSSTPGRRHPGRGHGDQAELCRDPGPQVRVVPRAGRPAPLRAARHLLLVGPARSRGSSRAGAQRGRWRAARGRRSIGPGQPPGRSWRWPGRRHRPGSAPRPARSARHTAPRGRRRRTSRPPRARGSDVPTASSNARRRSARSPAAMQ